MIHSLARKKNVPKYSQKTSYTVSGSHGSTKVCEAATAQFGCQVYKWNNHESVAFNIEESAFAALTSVKLPSLSLSYYDFL